MWFKWSWLFLMQYEIHLNINTFDVAFCDSVLKILLSLVGSHNKKLVNSVLLFSHSSLLEWVTPAVLRRCLFEIQYCIIHIFKMVITLKCEILYSWKCLWQDVGADSCFWASIYVWINDLNWQGSAGRNPLPGSATMQFCAEKLNSGIGTIKIHI